MEVNFRGRLLLLSTVARRWGRAAALGAVLVLVGGMFSSGAATAERAAGEAAPKYATFAKVRRAQIELHYTFAVENTTSMIKKLGSKVKFPEGTFEAVVHGGGRAAPMKGTLTLPPAESYFVAFGFMPVTSTVTLVPTGAAGTAKVFVLEGTAHIETDLGFYIELSNVRVDGVALEVGQDCRTVDPARVHLSGTVNLTEGSPAALLTASFTIPRFSGCGVSEDLDPLMTGLVSGPGNTMSTELRVSCTAAEYPCAQ